MLIFSHEWQGNEPLFATHLCDDASANICADACNR